MSSQPDKRSANLITNPKSPQNHGDSAFWADVPEFGITRRMGTTCTLATASAKSVRCSTNSLGSPMVIHVDASAVTKVDSAPIDNPSPAKLQRPPRFVIARQVEPDLRAVTETSKIESFHETSHSTPSDVLRTSGMGARLHLLDDDDNSVLHLAALHGDTVRVQSLVAALPKQVNAKNLDGSAPIHLAASSGCVASVKALLCSGADVSAQDATGATALHSACSNGFIDCAALLIASGACVNATDKELRTPLHTASNADVALLLLRNGASPTAATASGNTPLHFAAAIDDADTTAALLAHGADECALNRSGWAPLHVACEAGGYSTAEVLMEATSEPQYMYCNGVLPLHVAACKGDTSLIDLMLSKGVSVNCRTETRYTALHLAAIGGHSDAVRLLMARGADILATTPAKLSALQLAAAQHHVEVVDMLRIVQKQWTTNKFLAHSA